MAAPTLSTFIQGQGSVNADMLNTFQQSCDNYAQLRAFTGIAGLQVYARGTTAAGDGGQGTFYWNATSTATDNNSTVIVPTGAVLGAWILLPASVNAPAGTLTGTTLAANVVNSSLINQTANYATASVTLAKLDNTGLSGYVLTAEGPGNAPQWQPVGGANSGMTGFRNRIINGGMNIDQRNAGASQTFTAGAALAYSVDRFYGYCTGANVTGQRTANAGASGSPSQYVYQFTGASSVTGIGFAQRIEAVNCFDFAGGSATLSVSLANSLLTTVLWSAYYANTTDTFGTLASPTKTQFATGSFTVSSTQTRYSITVSVPSAGTTGIEILFSVGAQTSGTWQIGNVQLESGTAATSFERRLLPAELQMAQRYFEVLNHTITQGQATATNFSVWWQFHTTKRATPTVTQTTGNVNNAVQTSIDGFGGFTTASNTQSFIGTGSTAAAEL